MTSYVEGLVDSVVSVITNDGRVFTGILKSFDQSMNIVVKNCYEKVYTTEGVKFVEIGMYFIRGDNVSIVSEVDEEMESTINYKEIKAEQMPGMKIHLWGNFNVYAWGL